MCGERVKRQCISHQLTVIRTSSGKPLSLLVDLEAGEVSAMLKRLQMLVEQLPVIKPALLACAKAPDKALDLLCLESKRDKRIQIIKFAKVLSTSLTPQTTTWKISSNLASTPRNLD